MRGRHSHCVHAIFINTQRIFSFNWVSKAVIFVLTKMSSVHRAFAQKLSKWVFPFYWNLRPPNMRQTKQTNCKSSMDGKIYFCRDLAQIRLIWCFCVVSFNLFSYLQASCIGRSEECTKLSFEWYVCTKFTAHNSDMFYWFFFSFRIQQRVKVAVPLVRLR